jgi:ribosomal protein S18 acetylase RimI-like enzyme
MMKAHLYSMLDRKAAATWPSQYNQPLDQWLLRATPNLTSRRANSVLTVGDYPAEDWLEIAKNFYGHHGLLPRFHISTASPQGLDEQLTQLGYIKEYETMLMVADCDTVLSRSPKENSLPFEFSMQQKADSYWTNAFMDIEQFEPHRTPAYQQMMQRIVGSTAFAAVQHPDTKEYAAIGTAVREGSWAGLINIATHSRFRRQGIAGHMIGKLAIWCQEQGADRLFLQVMANNEPAQRLYVRLGFDKAFDYHYRSAPN